MKFDPTRHYRHSIRLQGYDYSQAGAYFVTIVTHNRACPFGDITSVEMRLNAAGEMIEKWWLELERKFPSVTLGAHVVMPNHFHGIICLVGVDRRQIAGRSIPTNHHPMVQNDNHQ
jgi:REP element-mobilizing transposase RayT